jgi:DNA-binding XRE family transcriptional regulator
LLVLKSGKVFYNKEMTSLSKCIGQKIKETRKRVKMTQFDLANLVGVDPKYISRIETGTSYPSLSVCEKIFDILNIKVKNIFEDDFDMDKEVLISSINILLKETSLKNLKVIKSIVESLAQNS